MKRVFVLLLLVLLLAEAAAPACAAEDEIALAEVCLASTPPDYENAALHYRRAGVHGNAEGYYRLAEMYEAGLLNVGTPCTDDLTALGMEQARKYYALAAQGGYEPAQDKLADSYQSITQDEAVGLMDTEPACVILDVRTQEEYDTGHIPGAICIPVESITAPPTQLPDYNQLILVYCRSGRRSKQAAQKLTMLGYTDVREFGGILDWKGELLTAQEDTAFLAFTGLSRMLVEQNAGAVIEKVYYTDGYGFSVSEFTTTEAEEIRALWEAICKIRLGEPSQSSITDWYPLIVFYLDNGRHYGVRFDGPWLDADRNYEIENAESFWALTSMLTAKYSEM